MQRKSLVFLSTLLLALLLNISGGRADWWIDPSSTQSSTDCGTSKAEACPCIANVLEHLKPNDIIRLLPGIYTGPLNTGITISVDGVQLLGSDPTTVIIDLNGSPTFLTITANGVVVASVTIKNGITANVNLGAINIQLTVDATVDALLDALRFNNVHFLNIQGTAILCADVNALSGAVSVNANANIFVNVVLNGCSFVNVTVNPVLVVIGRISLKLNTVSFDSCGSAGVNGAVVLAQKSSSVVLVAVTITNCQGGSLLDLNAAAALTLSGVLVLKANVVTSSLLNLNLNLNINILDLSVRLDANSAPVSCTNVRCRLLDINRICSNCGLVNLDLGSF